MTGFYYTELDKGEEILIGPVTSTSSISMSGPTQPGQTGISSTSGRTVGVTNKRVIVEEMGNSQGTKFMPVDKVSRVFLSRKGTAAQPVYKLERVDDSSGSSLKLGIQGVSMAEVSRAFPSAEVKEGGTGTPVAVKIILLAALAAGALCVGLFLLGVLTN